MINANFVVVTYFLRTLIETVGIIKWEDDSFYNSRGCSDVVSGINIIIIILV